MRQALSITRNTSLGSGCLRISSQRHLPGQGSTGQYSRTHPAVCRPWPSAAAAGAAATGWPAHCRCPAQYRLHSRWVECAPSARLLCERTASSANPNTSTPFDALASHLTHHWTSHGLHAHTSSTAPGTSPHIRTSTPTYIRTSTRLYIDTCIHAYIHTPPSFATHLSAWP